MSVISTLTNNAKAKFVVSTLLNSTKKGHNQLLQAWQESIDLVWASYDTPTITTILKEMGTDGANLFALSTRTYLFLEENEPGCTIEHLAKVREVVIHPDGTVTLA